MPLHAAFLRAVNLGGRKAPMERVRSIFESLGLGGVETFLASGNVVFEAPSAKAASLGPRIEGALRLSLGFDVTTFLRTGDELADILRCHPFPAREMSQAVAFNVAFLKEHPAAGFDDRLQGLRTAVDDFRVVGREVYWLCRVKQSDSTFSGAVLERALGAPATIRQLSTLQRLAHRHFPPGPA